MIPADAVNGNPLECQRRNEATEKSHRVGGRIGFIVHIAGDQHALNRLFFGDPANLTESAKTEEYYAALRAYKKTDHPVAFGWFGNWVGSGVSLENSLR